jgi:hypothetical protein
MNSGIVIDCIFIVGCAILGFAPFDKKRIRAGWAKLTFGIIAVIGFAKGVVCLAWDLHWFALGSAASSRLDAFLYHFVDGLLLGFILSLILSGQLSGTKRDLRYEPAA